MVLFLAEKGHCFHDELERKDDHFWRISSQISLTCFLEATFCRDFKRISSMMTFSSELLRGLLETEVPLEAH